MSGQRTRRESKLVTAVTAAVVCLPGLAACGSAQTAAPTGGVLRLSSPGTIGGYHVPLLRCTKAQEAAAGPPARTIRMISGQTIRATVGERIDILEGAADMRPESGQVQIRAGQRSVCQSASIQGRLPTEVLPLIITGPGRVEVSVNTPPVPPGVDGLAVFYIDSTKAS